MLMAQYQWIELALRFFRKLLYNIKGGGRDVEKTEIKSTNTLNYLFIVSISFMELCTFQLIKNASNLILASPLINRRLSKG